MDLFVTGLDTETQGIELLLSFSINPENLNSVTSKGFEDN